MRNELIVGAFIQIQRAADLGDTLVGQHHDPVGQRHRFDLIVGDIDHRAVGHAFLQLRDFNPCGDAQRRIEVRERFVKQVHFGVTHNSAANGDTLALPTRQRLGQAVQIILELQDPGGFHDRRVNLILGFLGDFQREGHVIAHGHMRI